MNNPIIETDLGEILKEIKSDQKKILEEIVDLKVGQARIDRRLNTQEQVIQELKESIKEVKESVKEVKGAQAKQVWALIALVFSAVIGLTGAFTKIVFFN